MQGDLTELQISHLYNGDDTAHLPLISLPRGPNRIIEGRMPEKLEIKGNLLLYNHKRGHIFTIYLTIL